MKNLKIIAYTLLLLIVSMSPQFAIAKPELEISTLRWIDLIPFSERNQNNSAFVKDHSSDVPAQQSQLYTVREELNGQKVKIAGFVIPLEGDSDLVTDFLLVPYFGACIHVPPPPPNQIIRVSFEEGVALTEIWDVVHVVGILKTESTDSDLAHTAYVIDGIKMEDYEK